MNKNCTTIMNSKKWLLVCAAVNIITAIVCVITFDRPAEQFLSALGWLIAALRTIEVHQKS